MNDSASATPSKARITHAAQQRWREGATSLLQQGQPPAAIDAWLQAQGCPPRLRQETIRQARANVSGAHRGHGMRLVAAGAGLAALCAGLLWIVLVGLHPPDDGRLHHVGLIVMAAAVGACGVPLLVFGLWKMLSGREANASMRVL